MRANNIPVPKAHDREPLLFLYSKHCFQMWDAVPICTIYCLAHNKQMSDDDEQQEQQQDEFVNLGEEEDDQQAEEEEEEEEYEEEEEEPESFFPATSSAAAPQQVSNATQKWKAENEQLRQTKDAQFAKYRKSLNERAEQTLNKIKQERQARIASKAKENREAQAKHQAALAKTGSGEEVSWKKLSVLVDLDKETEEKERMRLLFKDRVNSA